MHVLVMHHKGIHKFHSDTDRRLLVHDRVAPAAGYIQNIARPLLADDRVAGLPIPMSGRLDRVRRRRRRSQVPRLPPKTERVHGLLVVVPRRARARGPGIDLGVRAVFARVEPSREPVEQFIQFK